MAGAGDCLAYACGVGSAADGQAGWAPLALLAPMLPRRVPCKRQKQKYDQKMLLDVERVDRQTDGHRFSVLGLLTCLRGHQD